MAQDDRSANLGVVSARLEMVMCVNTTRDVGSISSIVGTVGAFENIGVVHTAIPQISRPRDPRVRLPW